MKAIIYTIDGKQQGDVELPVHFSEKPRVDLIKKAFLASQTQVKHGSKKGAGMRSSAKLSRRRKDYKTGYGRGMSRVPRKTLWRRGSQFGYVGAEAPGTTGGRKAHPPKSSKDVTKEMNTKERHYALRSALACTVIPEYVKERNHIFTNLPLIVEDSFESFEKTKDVKKTLELLGLKDELARVEVKKIRSGKGKLRGRKYTRKIGPLLVVSKNCPLQKSAKNIPGIKVVTVKNLNVLRLAPGGVPGRLTLFTPASIHEISNGSIAGGKQ